MGGAETDDGSDAAAISASLSDPQRFGVLFERHAEAVHRFLAHRAGHSEVEDLLSETFVTAFKTRHRYDASYREALPWLMGIAVNVTRHHWRAEQRRMSMVDRVARSAAVGPAGGNGSEEVEVAHVAEAVAQVDERYRDVLLLFAGAHLGYEDISHALQIPVGTVRSRLSRGRAQLRELLERSGQYLDAEEPTRHHRTEGERIS